MARLYNLDFKWNGSSSIIAGRKGFGKALNTFVAKTIDLYSFPYMPYRTGYMWKSKYIRADKDKALLIYTSRYAKYQHDNPTYNHFHPGIQLHPLATDHWEKWAWLNHRAEISKDVSEFRKKLSKP